MRRISLIALAFALVSAGLLYAKDRKAAAMPKQESLVAPEAVQASVTKVTTAIKWYDDLEAAKAEAKRTGKLIFWMHALGELTGTT